MRGCLSEPRMPVAASMKFPIPMTLSIEEACSALVTSCHAVADFPCSVGWRCYTATISHPQRGGGRHGSQLCMAPPLLVLLNHVTPC